LSQDSTNPIKSVLQKQLGSRRKFPEAHVIGISYTRIFGPQHKQTPEGHPIQISSGVFDASTETPLSSIMRAAFKHGIMPCAANWRLDMAEDVIQPVNGPAIPYDKVFYFTFLPEQELWKHKGIHGKVKNHFLDSHYVGKSHLHTVVDPSVANSLVPKKDGN
jgi:hypothetical protein